MQYSLLGHTGPAVSRLAFGAMTFTAGNRDMAAISKDGAGVAGVLAASAAHPRRVTSFSTADRRGGV